MTRIITNHGAMNIYDICLKSLVKSTTHILFMTLIGSCTDSNAQNRANSACVDADGNVYKTVVIGEQVWMAENLRTTKYSDGSKIRRESDKKRWKKLESGAWCFYDNDSIHVQEYGRLYNWYSVDDNHRNVCPNGWHVPNNAEWDDFALSIDDKTANVHKRMNASASAGAKMKSEDSWGENKSDSSHSNGFDAVPSGRRTKGSFTAAGKRTYWWSINDIDRDVGWLRYLRTNSRKLFRGSYYKNSGFSIRCVQNN